MTGCADTQWEAVAVADVIAGSDSTVAWPDIIWRHCNSGKLVYWQMEGLDHVAGGFLQPDAVPDLGWLIVGAGDFDGHSRDDLLLQNHTSEKLVVWFMDGTTRVFGSFLTPTRWISTANLESGPSSGHAERRALAAHRTGTA